MGERRRGLAHSGGGGMGVFPESRAGQGKPGDESIDEDGTIDMLIQKGCFVTVSLTGQDDQ